MLFVAYRSTDQSTDQSINQSLKPQPVQARKNQGII